MDWTLRIFGLLILAVFPSGQGIGVEQLDPANPNPGVVIDPNNDQIVYIFEDFTVQASPQTPLQVARIVGNGAVVKEDIFPVGINVQISSDGVIELHEEIDHDGDKWCKNLDLVTQTFCVVTISVRDGAGDVADIQLRVQDVNDNPPTLVDANSCNEQVVKENEVAGVCTFKASDPDRVVDKDKLVFVLTGEVEGEPGTMIFAVDPRSGNLGVNNADYEKRTLHKLTIDVEDSAGTSSVSPFTFFVYIEDVADELPIWTKLNPVLTVSEDAALDFTIFQIEATDGDRGVNSPLTYGMDENDYFKCSSDGNIQVKANLDATNINDMRGSLSFTLNVWADEVKDPKLRLNGTITIFVEDFDDKLVEIKTPPTQPSIRIQETFSGDIPSSLFTAIDSDPTLAYTYYTAEITGENGGPLDPELKAAIKLSPAGPYTRETSFSLSITGAIDFDIPVYWRTVKNFQVVLQQNGSTIEAVDFSIQVEDVNDEKPVWDFPTTDNFFTVEIEENTLQGTPLNVQLAANDADYTPDFHTLKYSFDSRTPDYLKITEDTGELTVTGDVDYELFKTETFRIKVSDGLADNDQFTNLVVNVLPLYDEQPSIRLSVSKYEINEGDYTGSLELPVNLIVSDADYPDINGDQFPDVAICYLSVDREEIESWFELEGCSKLKVVGNVDREKDMDNPYERIELTIMVEDPNTEANGNSSEAVLVLTIQDVNDNAPEFEDMAELNDLRVLEWDADIEETEQQRKVLDIYATDDDTKTEFCFSIVDDGKFAEWFEFQNGAQKDCNLRGRTALRRRDTDSGNVDRESDLFDGVDDPILDLIISVTDGEPTHNVPLNLRIRVEDRNDEKPIWDVVTLDLLSFEMDENDDGSCSEPPGLADLFRVYASDRDECSKYSKFGCITFVIEDSFGERFSVENTVFDDSTPMDENQTGLVSAKRCGIDRDRLQVSVDGTFGYDLTIIAYDNYIEGRDIQPGNSDSHTIRIIVKDLNDNDPQFIDPAPLDPPNIDLFTFSEDIEDEVQNLKFGIKDIDLDENSTMIATILSIEYDRNPLDGQPDREWDFDNMTDVPFVIGESDKKTYFNLDTSPVFDFLDQYGVFYVNIQLEDQSSAPRHATAKYAVKVTDTNNNFPTIELPKWGNQSVFICQDGETGEGKRVKVRGVGGNSEELEAFVAKDEDDPTTPNGQTDCFISDSSSDAVREYLEIVSTQGTDSSSCVLQWLKDWKYDENGYKEFVVILESRDRDVNDPKTSDPLEITLKMRAGLPEEPYFVDNSISMSIKENQAGVVDIFPDAKDANGEEDIIYYYIVGDSDDVLDRFELEDKTSTTLKVKTGKELDRETQDSYKIIILATNEPDVLPGLVQPPYSKSYLTISLEVEDVNDVTPKFPTNLISAGISAARTQIEDILDTSFPIEAMDPDIDDVITYVIATDIVTQNDSLRPVIGDNNAVKPFILERNGTKAQLRINFKPQPAHLGYFSFNISATDLVDHSSTVELRIYVVTDNNFVYFYFNNNDTYINQRRSKISEILTKFYEYTCVIDDVQLTKDSSTGAELGTSTVTTHFLNALQSAAISSEYIREWPSSNPDKFIEMVKELESEGLNYDVIAKKDDNGLTAEQKTIYALVAVCAVLAVCLLTVGTSCFFKNRGMTRKIRVMSASAGAENGVTTMGEKGALPNTGIYDANPIYSDEVDMKVPDLDARSTTSGGESLVAVEDQDDFNGYQDNNNPAFEDEFNTSGEEDNIYGSVRNPAFDDESHYQVMSEGTNYDYPASPPPPFESIQSNTQSGGTMRRNPLANMTIDSE